MLGLYATARHLKLFHEHHPKLHGLLPLHRKHRKHRRPLPLPHQLPMGYGEGVLISGTGLSSRSPLQEG